MSGRILTFAGRPDSGTACGDDSDSSTEMILCPLTIGSGQRLGGCALLRAGSMDASTRVGVVRYAVPLLGEIMTAITATDARKSLFGLIQQVNDDHTAVEVVSRHGNAVIMSKDDYDAMTETAYLLRTPANAERLLEAIERARRGEFEQHDLLDA